MARSITHRPRRWQICCAAPGPLRWRYPCTEDTSSIFQNCCAWAATLARRRSARRAAYSPSASRSAAATEAWVGRTHAVGHLVTPLVRMNSATSVAQSLSGIRSREPSLTIELLRTSRLGHDRPPRKGYLVNQTPSCHGGVTGGPEQQKRSVPLGNSVPDFAGYLGGEPPWRTPFGRSDMLPACSPRVDRLN